MASMNKVILAGNLTRDPELRRLSDSTAVAEFGLAISETFKNRNNETVERVCFVDIVVWGRQAETSEQYLNKGSPVLIEGRLVYDSWENDKGEKRSKLRVRADRVQFLSRRPRQDEGQPDTADPGAAPARDTAGPPVHSVTEEEMSGDSDDLPF